MVPLLVILAIVLVVMVAAWIAMRRPGPVEEMEPGASSLPGTPPWEQERPPEDERDPRDI